MQCLMWMLHYNHIIGRYYIALTPFKQLFTLFACIRPLYNEHMILPSLSKGGFQLTSQHSCKRDICSSDYSHAALAFSYDFSLDKGRKI